MAYLIVGLGNKGEEYAMTRHNLGRMTVKALGKQFGLRLKFESKFKGLYGACRYEDEQIHFLLPQTYMNESGRAVQAAMNFFKLPLSSLIVVVDDCALEFASLRVRLSGSSGGHNGLKSIARELNTQEYCRLRMGIGRHDDHQEMSDYVLNRFSLEEQGKLPEVLEDGCKALLDLMTKGFESVARSINKKQKTQCLNEEKTIVGEKQ